MDWSNERYVRSYTRDTADVLAIGWKGRATLWSLQRRLDRSGVLDTNDDSIVAEMLRMPVEIVSEGLKALADREVIQRNEDSIYMPNFVEAQESVQSDQQRQRESRARRAAMAKAGSLSPESPDLAKTSPETRGELGDSGQVAQDVEKSQPGQKSRNVTVESQNVTDESQNVTKSHMASHGVTPTLPKPNLPVPSLPPRSGELAESVRDATLEKIYESYPCKSRKKRGMLAAKESIQTHEQLNELQAAVLRMSNLWDGHPTRYCPHWGAFIAEELWKDDVLPEPRPAKGSEPRSVASGPVEAKELSSYPPAGAKSW